MAASSDPPAGSQAADPLSSAIRVTSPGGSFPENPPFEDPAGPEPTLGGSSRHPPELRTNIEALAPYLDRSRTVSIQERADAVARLHYASKLAMLLWPLFAITDVVIVTMIQKGDSILPLLGLRFCGWACSLITLTRLQFGPTPSERLLTLLDAVMFLGAAFFISAQCLYFGGIDSAYGHGMVTIMLVRSITLQNHWKVGALFYGAIWLCFPGMMLVGALFFPHIAKEFGEPDMLGGFILNNFFIASGAMCFTIAGHMLWSVRRQSYLAKNLGRYKLKRRIGVGGMSEVWVAEHSGLQTEVALKILKIEAGRTKEAIGRFEREVLAITKLSHPNTIHIIDHGVTPEGIWYYAMELLEGTDLLQLVAREGPMPAERVIHFSRQACGSLAEAHDRGFVHRDIKPENLFVTSRGGVHDFLKVLDFGIAKVTEDLEKTHLTRTGIMQGTPRYMCPEAIMGKSVDHRGDIYSLGCVMYFLLTGHAPFEAGSVAGLLMQHLHNEPLGFREVGFLDVPADLEAVIMRCLRKDPAERFDSVRDLQSALASCETAGRWNPEGPISPRESGPTRLSPPDPD